MKHIPNLLSVFRILLIPFLVWQLLEGHTVMAGLLLLLSALTDLLDGKLARHFHWISDLGKVLDPAADKLTQAAVSLTLAFLLGAYWFLFAFLIIKDLILLTLGAYLIRKGVKIEGARWFGKVSTFVYYVTMTLIVLFPQMPSWSAILLISAAVLCALISALLYRPEFLRYKHSHTTRE